MTDVLMILGDYEFKLDTAEFRKLDRDNRQNKAELKRVGRKSASQHMGTMLDTMRLNGFILPHWKGGWSQMDTLRGMANDGVPYDLVDAFGRNRGLWEIVGVKEGETDYFQGAPTKINFTITLREYGEDDSPFDVLAAAASYVAGLL